MRKRIAEISGIVLRSWDTLICFEVLYRAIGYGLLFPLIRSQLENVPRLLGVLQLGQQNVGLVLHSLPAMLLLAGIFLLLAFYLLFEIVALLLYCEAGWKRRRITLGRLCRKSFQKTALLFHPRRIAVLLLAAPLLLSVFSFASGWLRGIRVPEFILEYIQAAPVLPWIYSGVLLGCNWLLFRYLFGLPAMLLERAGFRSSWRESGRLLKGRQLHTLGLLLGLLGMLAAAVIAAVSVIVLLCAGCAKFFSSTGAGRGQFQFYFIRLRQTSTITVGAFASVILCAVILVLYHHYRHDTRVARVPRSEREQSGWKQTIKRAGFVAFTLVILLLTSESELGGNIPLHTAERPQIVAHRAGALFAPENTVAALEQAIADGADQAEIDVQQLRDGTLVVLHDATFQRTTGQALAVSDASWDMVRTLDAGAFFSAAYTGEPVATLEDMLRAAKGRIRLMIELKGADDGLRQAVLAQIRQYGMEAQCSIASMELDVLRQVKEDAPALETVYISALLISDRYDLQYVDSYSVETTSLTVGMVIQAHAQGKKIYGWTANSTKSLDKLLRCEVDGLVTDNVLLAAYCIDASGEDLLLDGLTKLFFGPAETQADSAA